MEKHTLCDCAGRGQGHSSRPPIGCSSGKLLLVSQAHEDSRYHTVVLKSGVWGRGGREERGRERVNHTCSISLERLRIIRQVRKGTQGL